MGVLILASGCGAAPECAGRIGVSARASAAFFRRACGTGVVATCTLRPIGTFGVRGSGEVMRSSPNSTLAALTSRTKK